LLSLSYTINIVSSLLKLSCAGGILFFREEKHQTKIHVENAAEIRAKASNFALVENNSSVQSNICVIIHV